MFNFFKRKPRTISQEISIVPYSIKEIVSENDIPFSLIPWSEFQMYQANPLKKYFCSIISNRIFFSSKSGAERLIIKY